MKDVSQDCAGFPPVFKALRVVHIEIFTARSNAEEGRADKQDGMILFFHGPETMKGGCDGVLC